MALLLLNLQRSVRYKVEFQRGYVHIHEGYPATSCRPTSTSSSVTIVLMIAGLLSTPALSARFSTVLPVSPRPNAIIIVDGKRGDIAVLDIAASQRWCWTLNGFARLMIALELPEERGSSWWGHRHSGIRRVWNCSHDSGKGRRSEELSRM